MMTHDEMIAVIQAHKDGKQIQSCPKGTGKWVDNDNPLFNFMTGDYRIKPEPIVLWGAFDEEGELYAVRFAKAELHTFLGNDAAKSTIKKFVEVTE